MNWQKAAIEDLKKYQSQKDSLDNIRERICALKEKCEAIKCVSTDSTPVQGGSSRIEDRIIDNIVERQRLTYTYRATEKLVRLVEKGLAVLDEREKTVLNKLFIVGYRHAVEDLCAELYVEKSQVYRIKDKALYKFTITMYGLSEF